MIRGERWIGDGPAEVAAEAARRFVALSAEAVAARGRFVVALAGGSTPKAMYQLLAAPPLAAQVAWQQVEVLFGDERAVPPDHADSNYGMAARALLDHVPLDRGRVHRIEGERDDADVRYEEVLRGLEAGAPPVIDLILLGMGGDGHTLSLFPHTAALGERTRWCVRNEVPKLSTHRFTLTVPVVAAARTVLVAACGAEKAPVLRALESSPEDPAEHPILLARPASGQLVWLLDSAALSQG